MESVYLPQVLSVLMSIWIALTGFFSFFTTPQHKQIKNVIYMIGDGMGANHLEKAKKDRGVELVMDSFEFRGGAITRSLSGDITDSAAGGTALATGVRTENGMVGVYNGDKDALISYPKNIVELCKENGKMVGIVTTDVTSGATPSAFSAHTSSRENIVEITEDQLTSDIDLIWGRANGFITESSAEESGYECIATYNEMMALEEGSKSFGQFTNHLWKTVRPDKKTPNLEQMAMKAVDILDDTDEGFFFMIEGAHIDKHSHKTRAADMVEALIEFDETVEAMLRYAEADDETLVVITADHETGGITLKDGEYVFSDGNHSAAPVPVLVYGSDEIIENGEIVDNYMIPIRISRILGFEESEFPVSVKTESGEDTMKNTYG